MRPISQCHRCESAKGLGFASSARERSGRHSTMATVASRCNERCPAEAGWRLDFHSRRRSRLTYGSLIISCQPRRERRGGSYHVRIQLGPTMGAEAFPDYNQCTSLAPGRTMHWSMGPGTSASRSRRMNGRTSTEASMTRRSSHLPTLPGCPPPQGRRVNGNTHSLHPPERATGPTLSLRQ